MLFWLLNLWRVLEIELGPQQKTPTVFLGRKRNKEKIRCKIRPNRTRSMLYKYGFKILTKLTSCYFTCGKEFSNNFPEKIFYLPHSFHIGIQEKFLNVTMSTNFLLIKQEWVVSLFVHQLPLVKATTVFRETIDRCQLLKAFDHANSSFIRHLIHICLKFPHGFA